MAPFQTPSLPPSLLTPSHTPVVTRRQQVEVEEGGGGGGQSPSRSSSQQPHHREFAGIPGAAHHRTLPLARQRQHKVAKNASKIRVKPLEHAQKHRAVESCPSFGPHHCSVAFNHCTTLYCDDTTYELLLFCWEASLQGKLVPTMIIVLSYP